MNNKSEFLNIYDLAKEQGLDFAKGSLQKELIDLHNNFAKDAYKFDSQSKKIDDSLGDIKKSNFLKYRNVLVSKLEQILDHNQNFNFNQEDVDAIKNYVQIIEGENFFDKDFSQQDLKNLDNIFSQTISILSK